MIKDTRSQHAIIIDKALRAKNRTSNYEVWLQNRSTMDYTGYDHPAVMKSPDPKTQTTTTKQPEARPVKSDEPLTAEQKREARTIFLSQSQDRQVKDIQRRQNVITKSYQFQQYRNNPYGTDIEGVDTPDEETEKERVNVLSNVTDTPVIYNSFRGGNVGGFFTPSVRIRQQQVTTAMRRKGPSPMLREAFGVGERKPAVYLPTKFNFQKDKGDLFHELGHAFEYKVFGGTGNFKDKQLGFGNNNAAVNKSPFKKRDMNKFTIFNYQTRPLINGSKTIKTRADLASEQSKVSSMFSGGRSHVSYRARSQEVFANAFQGFIQNPKKAKKTGYAYNVIKNTPMFKEYKKQNKMLAFKQIKRLTSFKF